MSSPAKSPGIVLRHARSCPSVTAKARDAGAACNCEPTVWAWVYDKTSDRKLTKTCESIAAAKLWRAQTIAGLDAGTVKAPTATTFRDAALEWIEAAQAGEETLRSGEPYKPSTIRGYDRDLRLYLLPEFGPRRLSEIQSVDFNRLAKRLSREGLSPSKVRNAMIPARCVYRRARELGVVSQNPTRDLALPTGSGSRDRVASREEARQLLDALPADLRAIFATAFYAGLRLGELQALRWSAVDLVAGTVDVVASWDPVEGLIAPKTKTSRRRVQIPARLVDELARRKDATGRDGDAFVFGDTPTEPFQKDRLYLTSRRAWDAENVIRAERDQPPLVAISPHECRHTFITWMTAHATATTIGHMVGHSEQAITARYSHPLEEAARLAADRLGEILEAD